MTERIFVATDLSEGADEALRAAHARAAATGADLGVCYVHPELFGVGARHADRGEDIAVEMRRIDDELRTRLRERIASCMPGDHPELMIRHGTPHATILRCADEWSADLIVLGSGARGGLVRRVLGSVADQVVRHAHCAVLVARRAQARGVVLVATDLSDPSFPAVIAGRDEARRRDARLVVIHAVDFGSVAVTIEEMVLDVTRPEGGWNADERLRRRFTAQLRVAMKTCGARAEIRVVDGAAAPAILRVADELDAELVVIGTHGRSGLARIALGSTAERVVRTAARPVLAVRLAGT